MVDGDGWRRPGFESQSVESCKFFLPMLGFPVIFIVVADANCISDR